MTGRHVALLRGINVGKAKRVAMADLRALVESLGYDDVQTLLNSGNVLFSAPKTTPATAAARIEKALAAQLGVSARVTAVSAEEVAEIVAANPLGAVATDPSRLLVAVFADEASCRALLPLAARDWAPDALALGRRAAYLWCAAGALDSPLSKAAGKAWGDAATTRNWATMLKLLALAAPGDRPDAA